VSGERPTTIQHDPPMNWFWHSATKYIEKAGGHGHAAANKKKCSTRNLLESVVGAVGFELTTPYAQGSGITSNGSLVCAQFLIFTTIWGACFLAQK
jgi:hypothetical protein